MYVSEPVQSSVAPDTLRVMLAPFVTERVVPLSVAENSVKLTVVVVPLDVNVHDVPAGAVNALPLASSVKLQPSELVASTVPDAVPSANVNVPFVSVVVVVLPSQVSFSVPEVIIQVPTKSEAEEEDELPHASKAVVKRMEHPAGLQAGR